MTLGARLKQFIVKPKTQNWVALEWLIRRQKAEGKELWASSYLESQLSRLLREDPGAVRFFFERREHAKLLLDLLDVPEDERPAMIEEADRVMKSNGQPAVRLVVDLTSFSSKPETATKMFEVVWATVVEGRPIAPAALLITQAQYAALPRSYDDAGEWLRIERVDDGVAGPKRAIELAADQALLVSPHRFDPPGRWAAAAFDGKRLLLDPTDALEVFARDGVLPWPEVEHDLALLVGDQEPSTKLDAPTLPVELRRTLVALRTESLATSVHEEPAVRLALARALDLVATSTENERHLAEIAEAVRMVGLDLAPTTETELAAVLERARQRVMPMAGYRIGDDIHLVNPDEQRAGLAHPRITIHRVDPEVPALVRFQKAVASYTQDDYERDPTLSLLVEKVDPEGRERRAFLHARASLMGARAVSLPPRKELKPVGDWRGALKRLLLATPAPTRIAVPVDKNCGGFFLIHPILDSVTATMMPKVDKNSGGFLIHAEHLKAARNCSAVFLDGVPREQAQALSIVNPICDEVILSRDRKTVWVKLKAILYTEQPFGEREPELEQFRIEEPPKRAAYSYQEEKPVAPKFDKKKHAAAHAAWQKKMDADERAPFPLLLPTTPAEAQDTNTWMDLLECSQPLHGRSPDPDVLARVRASLRQRPDGAPQTRQIYGNEPPRKGYLTGYEIEEIAVHFADDVWTSADREVAIMLIALRRALDSGELARMPDGTILIPLPNGLCAVADIQALDPTGSAETAQPTVATIEIEKFTPGKDAGLRRMISSGISTHGESLFYSLPRAVRFTDGGFSLRLWFEAAPLLLGTSVTDLAVASGAIGGGEATAQAERQRRKEKKEASHHREEEEERRCQAQAVENSRLREEEAEEQRRQQEEDDDDD